MGREVYHPSCDWSEASYGVDWFKPASVQLMLIFEELGHIDDGEGGSFDLERFEDAVMEVIAKLPNTVSSNPVSYKVPGGPGVTDFSGIYASKEMLVPLLRVIDRTRELGYDVILYG